MEAYLSEERKEGEMQEPSLVKRVAACGGHHEIVRHPEDDGWRCKNCGVIVADDSLDFLLEVMEARADRCPHSTATRRGGWGLYFYCDRCGDMVATIRTGVLNEEVLACGNKPRIKAWRKWKGISQPAYETLSE